MNKIKYAYIAGSGRSGSTLLDLLLNANSSICSTGELKFVWDRALKDQELCGCGKKVIECTFWKKIFNRCSFDIEDKNILDEIIKLREHFSRIRTIHRWRSHEYMQALKLYENKYLFPLIDSIHIEVGDRYILDSSKNFGHLYVLSRIKQIDLKVIHLIRDSRAVAHSWNNLKKRTDSGKNDQYMPRFNSIFSATQWVIHNFLIKIISKNIQYKIVRYENLLSNPEIVLNEIFNFLDVKNDVIFNGPKYFLKENHTIAGNPLRMENKNILLKVDNRWKQDMNLSNRLVVYLITWPFLLLWR